MVNFSCSNQQSGPSSDENQKAYKESKIVNGVCIYNYSVYGLPVLKDVKDKESRFTFAKLGESLKYLGEKDTLGGNNYSKIELSDGSIGWSRSDYIVEDAYPAAVIESTPVYERPDILTKSRNKEYKQIDFVAVVKEQDDWLKVVGINRRNQGWIRKGVVSTNEEDVAMAILVIKELYKDGKIVMDKVEDFINNAPFSESRVISILKDIMQQKMMEKAGNEGAMDNVDSEVDIVGSQEKSE